jgi:hypothetical protein
MSALPSKADIRWSDRRFGRRCALCGGSQNISAKLLGHAETIHKNHLAGVLGPQNVDVAAGNFWALILTGRGFSSRRVNFGDRIQKIVLFDSTDEGKKVLRSQ